MPDFQAGVIRHFNELGRRGRIPFMTASEVTTLTLDKGWVTEASVEDVKLLPGVRRTMFRLEGGDWVAQKVVKEVQRGHARFVLNTGDLVWWGKQAASPSENPYWTLVNEKVLKQLPPPDDEMRAAGLPGRMFPAVGNHEVWDGEHSRRPREAAGCHRPESTRTMTSARPSRPETFKKSQAIWFGVRRS